MVQWISHRGIRDASSGVCSENSFRAFTYARDAGFSWLETDLRCTADGQLILSHDRDLKRCFGSDIVVESASSNELRKLTGPYGDKLLFFDEFAETFADLNWILDIKPESAQRVVQVLSEEPYRSLVESRVEQLKFLFWSKAPQSQFLATFPKADCLAQQAECWRAGLATLSHLPLFGGMVAGKTYSLPPHLGGIDLYKAKIFQNYMQKDAKILAYLPETRAQADRAIAAGAEYVLANSALFAQL